ncbi:hypothetical protein HDV02_003300 [Globomyces sp. JEL0801]|nr:hypothetical protein HDV02_003300 [Globomyces sp. JEL0801]
MAYWNNWRFWMYIALTLLFTVGTILAMQNQSAIFKSLGGVIKFINDNKLIGAVIFVFIFATSTVFLIPASIFTVASGVIFRPVFLSIFLVLLGGQLAIIISCTLGRTLLKPFIKDEFDRYPKMKAIDESLQYQGWKVVLLLKLNPMIGNGLSNYLLSGTSIPLHTIMLGSLGGNLPDAIVYSFIGSVLGSLNQVENMKTPLRTQLIYIIVGGCVTVLSTTFITIVARKALNNIVDLDDMDQINTDPTISQTPLKAEDKTFSDITLITKTPCDSMVSNNQQDILKTNELRDDGNRTVIEYKLDANRQLENADFIHIQQSASNELQHNSIELQSTKDFESLGEIVDEPMSTNAKHKLNSQERLILFGIVGISVLVISIAVPIIIMNTTATGDQWGVTD